ncbi:MAG TPA: hypothetical protein VIY28_15460 [Pseudonocardiaceae bacterium]
MTDPWVDAWVKLRAFIDAGATEKEVTEYAKHLGRELPQPRDPEAYALKALAVQRVITDIEGATNG